MSTVAGTEVGEYSEVAPKPGKCDEGDLTRARG